MTGEKLKLTIPIATVAIFLVAYLVWNFTAWAGHETRITVGESSAVTKEDLAPIITGIAVLKEGMKRIDNRIENFHLETQ